MHRRRWITWLKWIVKWSSNIIVKFIFAYCICTVVDGNGSRFTRSKLIREDSDCLISIQYDHHTNKHKYSHILLLYYHKHSHRLISRLPFNGLYYLFPASILRIPTYAFSIREFDANCLPSIANYLTYTIKHISRWTFHFY